VTIATHGLHRPPVEQAGLAFAPVRPDLTDLGDLDDTMRRAMDLYGGSEFVLRQMVLAHVDATAADMMEACRGADLIVGHVVGLTAAPVAEALGIPRVHVVLQPWAMFSVHDPGVVPGVPLLTWLGRVMPLGARHAGLAFARRLTRPWFAPVDALRRRLGLPPAKHHPMLQIWSPLLNLALFSPRFGPPQPDWPANTVTTGFPEWVPEAGWDRELLEFLEAGEPPVVFTLGSSAVYAAGNFYDEAAKAAAKLGVRAVLLTGPDGRNALAKGRLNERVRAFAFAPHAKLFPRAAAIVHQGGIGTTARALASGRPMLVVPWSHDQPDNADRCLRLGVGRVLGRGHFRAARVERELRALLADEAMRARAAALGAEIRAENGAETAAAAIESCLGGARAAVATR
jgi:UDP:flavonoid glycosyltransferase YjiC (YdhE family)